MDLIFPAEHDALVRVRLEQGADGPLERAIEIDDPTGNVVRAVLRGIGDPAGVGSVDAVLDRWIVRRNLGTSWRTHVKRPGRSRRPDVFYAEWAFRYVGALPGATAKLVDEEVAAGRHTSRAAVLGYLNKARARGLLTEAPVGKEGGELTDKARGLLGLHERGV